jgi:hypothetical protein
MPHFGSRRAAPARRGVAAGASVQRVLARVSACAWRRQRARRAHPATQADGGSYSHSLQRPRAAPRRRRLRGDRSEGTRQHEAAGERRSCAAAARRAAHRSIDSERRCIVLLAPPRRRGRRQLLRR